MGRQTEGRLVATLQTLVRNNGGQAIKTHPAMGIAGLPDLLICAHGRFAAWEIKQPGLERTVTARQRHWLNKFAAAGAQAAVVTSTTQARQLLQELKARTDMEHTVERTNGQERER
jgi:hypothetical protein